MNKISIRRLAVLGMCAALSIVLVYTIRFPIFPATPFLEYEPADIPIFICALLFGPVSGIALTIVVSLIQGLTVSAQSGWIGIVMHIFATGSFVVVSGLICKHKKTKTKVIFSFAVGVITMTAVMVIWNLFFTPIFMGTPISAVIDLLPFIILFNLIKAAVNATVALIIYKSISKIFFKQAAL